MRVKLTPSSGERVWRVEDSLVDLGAVRPLAFFARNAHRYSERWKRLALLYVFAVVRILLYATSPVLSSRVLHWVLRGMSRDRLDVLGDEYFKVFVQPRLKRPGVAALQAALRADPSLVLVSQGVEHIVRPLAQHLGVQHFIANRVDFRDGSCTGRLLEPVIHSRGGIALLASRDSHGETTLSQLGIDLGVDAQILRRAVRMVHAVPPEPRRTLLVSHPRERIDGLSVRDSLSHKRILLIGATGFIGKVWLVKLLHDLPEVGRVYLLIRRQRSMSAQRRFEKIVEESPAFEPLYRLYGDDLPRFMSERITVVEGDTSRPNLGLAPDVASALQRQLDVVVNSGGLTDFNPDLRNALAANVDAIDHMLAFIRGCDHAALLHLSTCYVVGERDGRITEALAPNYTPRGQAGFDADAERVALHERVERSRSWPPDPGLLRELETPLPTAAEADAPGDAAAAGGDAVTNGRGNGSRFGWLRKVLTEAGTHRARELGWPNSYVFTKSLGESIIAAHGADLPIAIVRPAIVETSLQDPFEGWNEGLNTSAPLSYLLGTTFRQLPANERKCLDIIPVDLVCRGMTLVAAALVERCHQPLYQLATSVTNPCNMKRSIELTSLAHRKYYREQKGYRYWWKMRMDAIPVSKTRYQRLSAPRYQAILSRIRKVLSPMPFKVHALVRAERAVTRVAKLVEIYEPFILENEHVFEARNVHLLSAALPADEREQFGYELENFDWRHYWINVHIPAMRKWCYPLIEGRPITCRRRANFRLTSDAGRSLGTPIGHQAIG